MAEIPGRVVAVDGELARVECAAEAAGCAACARGRGCSWRRPGPGLLRVPSVGSGSGRLRPGDAVLVAVDDAELLSAALRIYLPPLLGLLALPAACRALGLTGDGPALLAAVIGLVLGLLVGRALTAGPGPRVRLRNADPPP